MTIVISSGDKCKVTHTLLPDAKKSIAEILQKKCIYSWVKVTK